MFIAAQLNYTKVKKKNVAEIKKKSVFFSPTFNCFVRVLPMLRRMGIFPIFILFRVEENLCLHKMNTLNILIVLKKKQIQSRFAKSQIIQNC